MNIYKKILFYVLLTSFFAGCASLGNNSILSLFGREDKIDTTLPIIKEVRTIPDVRSVGFEWDMPSDISSISGYILYTLEKNGKLKKIATIKNPRATHYYDSSLSPQTYYNYQISTLGKNGSVSPRSPIIKIKTSYIDPIESVFASKDYPKEIKIIWSPHPNPSVLRYLVQKQDSKGKFETIGVVKNRLYVEFFDKNLPNAKSYNYRIIAESFEGAKSLPSQVVTGKTKLPPNNIENIQASKNLPREIKITWNKSSQEDVKKYKIYASKSSNGNFNEIGETSRTYFIEKISTDGTIRFYKVVGVDNAGIEGEEPDTSIQGQTLSPPLPPIFKTAYIKNHNAFIQWQPSSDPRVVEYAIYRYEGNSSRYLRFSNITQNYFIDKEIKPNIKYKYQVVSVDKNGIDSSPTQEITLIDK